MAGAQYTVLCDVAGTRIPAAGLHMPTDVRENLQEPRLPAQGSLPCRRGDGVTELPPLPYGDAPAPTKRGFGSGAGRKPGQRDKVTLALKEAILLAAEEVGDALAASEPGRTGGLAGYLTMVASTDVKSFCGLLGRVLPMTIKGEGEGGGIIVEIVKRTYGPQDAAE